MAPARRQSNGRSPLVNQQRQITSFFTKHSSSPSTSPSPVISNTEIKSVSKPNPNPSSITPSPFQTKAKKPLLVVGQIPNSKSSPNLSPSPSPTTPPLQVKPKKPLLVIGQSPSPSTPASDCATPIAGVGASKTLYGDEVVNQRIRVYWPLDKIWYDGCVKSFDKASGMHLVQYDDSEEELLDLSKEKIELVKEPVKRFRRLRRFSIKEDEVEEEEKMQDLESGDDDSTDEDWGKNVEKEAVDDEMEDLEDEKDDGAHSSKKRKLSGDTKSVSAKKIKTVGDVKKGDCKVTLDVNSDNFLEPTKNNNGGEACALTNTLVGDASERFGTREAEKFRFLGKDRRDAKRRLPGDVNYDPKTLYLPPHFVNGLTGGQRQWWDFKSKHMDKVLFFKMGKFYELYEMDAHVGVKELDLQYMKGEQPHCGFPEKNFSVNVEKLARKGYRVLVVEQTETPEQLKLRKENGSKDKVVKREICAIVTKGTLTEGEMMSANPEASYLMSVTEANQHDQRIFGVCMVDVATSRIIIGQFQDDLECNALSCLLSQLRPVEIIKPANLLSPETENVLLRHTRNPIVNELVPLLEFWDAEKTTSRVGEIYTHINGQSASLSPSEAALQTDSHSENGGKDCLPQVLSELMTVKEDGIYALSALGGTLFYLKQAFLDETLLRFAKFELLPRSGLSDITANSHMVLDAAALENLEIFENSRNGDPTGTLYTQLNHCVTAFGKRLLKSWLSRPLYHLELIKERQDAVAGLKEVNNLAFALEFRKELSRLPDMERLLARIFSSSEASGRNSSRVTLYEDASKKQLQEFISALRGCEVMTSACSSLSNILENADSKLLNHLLTPGKGLPDIQSVLRHFKDAFDWVEANNSGRIIPREGADMEYDSACKVVEEIESSLIKHLKEQRKLIGDPSIKYVSIGKDDYLLEVPESFSSSIPRDYELRSSKKGFFRYWSPFIQNCIGKLSHAEAEKESKLKSIMQRLVARFCEHHYKWRQLVATAAELDVLISIAIASDMYEGPTCRPVLVESSNPDDVPCLSAKSLGHPILRSDSLGKGTFVPNDFDVGGPGCPSFILLTGPNMGGKSTLLRQVCLAVVLAQVGADVPAESFKFSPVDRIFVRMGAKDHIMAAQSTFLTELLETASMLSSATHNSLVALDELGRGTATSDGQAIAASVLEHLVDKVHCRGMFSTHYHRLAVEYQKNPKVSLCHMGCQVGQGVGGIEEVTFLYKLTLGACPKSYGVNVARLAGLPDSVLQKAVAKSQEFEGKYGKHKQHSENSDHSPEDKIMAFIQNLTILSEETSCNVFSELLNRARLLSEQS